MVDTVSKSKRSEIMSKIRSWNTKPELVVRRFLFSQGFRYRLYDKSLPGNPDIVLRSYNTVIFVHGCFWHGHKCNIGSGNRIPTTNFSYWNNKIYKNIKRFQSNRRKLRRMKWNIILIWECETKQPKKILRKLSPLLEAKSYGK
jgi:DNA mismatch endonuclease, patch repair protein